MSLNMKKFVQLTIATVLILSTILFLNTVQAVVFPWQKPHNLWTDMRQHLTLVNSLPDQYPPILANEIKWFASNPIYLNRLVQNASPYIYYIYQETQKRNMPAEIALIPMIESAYDPFAFSRTGAVGLWQMMPGTASGFRLTINWWYDGRRDVVASTRAALNYLSYLHDFFGDWLLAIAAYDSGEGTIQQALDYNKAHHRSTSFWDLPLPEETKTYVPKLLALAAIINNPPYYGINLPPIDNQPYFSVIDMGQQIDISSIAKMSDTSVDEIRQLNPGFRRWTTTPNQAYALLIPENKAILFKKNLIETTDVPSVTWVHHIVKSGDNLSALANQYHTSASILKNVNHLQNNIIHINQPLLIPVSAHRPLPVANAQTTDISETHLPGPKQVLHVVQKGETLNSISKQFDIKTQEIMFWNQMKDKTIYPDQKLLLWITSAKPSVLVHHYTVKSGDNLINLAKKFHTNAVDIKTENNLKTNLIRAGEKLTIRETISSPHHWNSPSAIGGNQMIIYHVQNGDTLSTIAKHYHLSVADLCDWNHLAQTALLKINQRVLIYA